MTRRCTWLTAESDERHTAESVRPAPSHSSEVERGQYVGHARVEDSASARPVYGPQIPCRGGEGRPRSRDDQFAHLWRLVMFQKGIVLGDCIHAGLPRRRLHDRARQGDQGPRSRGRQAGHRQVDQGEHPGVQQPRRGRDRRELDRRGRVHSQRRRADPRAGRHPEGVRGVLQDAEGQADAGGPSRQPSFPVRGHGRFGSHPAAEKRTRRS